MAKKVLVRFVKMKKKGLHVQRERKRDDIAQDDLKIGV